MVPAARHLRLTHLDRSADSAALRGLSRRATWSDGRRVAVARLLIAALVFIGAWRVSAQSQAAAPRVFGSDAGLVLNFIKPDKTADFEAVVEKLHEVLKKSKKPERRQQAASWKVFKSPDPAAGGAVLYVFVMDPAVKGADYTASTLLGEGLPAAEATDLYKKYAEAYAGGQNFVNMTIVSDFAK